MAASSPLEPGPPAFNFGDGAQVPASRAGKVERSANSSGVRFFVFPVSVKLWLSNSSRNLCPIETFEPPVPRTGGRAVLANEQRYRPRRLLCCRTRDEDGNPWEEALPLQFESEGKVRARGKRRRRDEFEVPTVAQHLIGVFCRWDSG